MKPEKPTCCDFCQREVDLSFHHLVPKKVQDRRWAKSLHPEKELIHYGIWVCNDCHKKIHRLFDHKQLAEHYYTKEAILGNEEFQRFVRWVRKQKKAVKRTRK